MIGRHFAPSDIEIRIIRSQTDFAMAMAIRAAVFLAEENITYQDEFDGNDFVGTQLLVLVKGDPAGVMRCRWFADFALFERVGIRKCYRSYAVLRALARGALDLCGQKGYRTVAGRARGDIVKYWHRLGGIQSGPPQDHVRGTLIPIIHELKARPGLRTIPFGPFGDPDYESMIAQEEGNWDFAKLDRIKRAAAE